MARFDIAQKQCLPFWLNLFRISLAPLSTPLFTPCTCFPQVQLLNPLFKLVAHKSNFYIHPLNRFLTSSAPLSTTWTCFPQVQPLYIHLLNLSLTSPAPLSTRPRLLSTAGVVLILIVKDHMAIYECIEETSLIKLSVQSTQLSKK